MDDVRQEELKTLVSIYPELLIDPSDAFTVTLELPVSPENPLLVRFAKPDRPQQLQAVIDAPEAAHELKFAHLPPLLLHSTLPLEYPADSPPVVKLSAHLDWIPREKISELEHEVLSLWEEYGRGPVLFFCIDHLQQAAERGFDLDGRLTLPAAREDELVMFNRRSIETIFNAGTYDCGICLEPKKGVNCE